VRIDDGMQIGSMVRSTIVHSPHNKASLMTFFATPSNSSRITILAALLLVAPASAQALPILVTGNATGASATASGTLTYDVATDQLTLSLTNTSPFDARITGLGFDLIAGDFTDNSSSGLNGFSGNSPGGFTFTDAGLGNVNQFNGAVLDFGWLTSSNFSGGSPNDGMPPLPAPGSTLVFTTTATSGSFPVIDESQLAVGLYVRFQRVGDDGEASDVGRVTITTEQPPPIPVPEPASLLLLGAGLIALARRRGRSAQAES
jgi:hypothetical protein